MSDKRPCYCQSVLRFTARPVASFIQERHHDKTSREKKARLLWEVKLAERGVVGNQEQRPWMEGPPCRVCRVQLIFAPVLKSEVPGLPGRGVSVVLVGRDAV